MFLVFVYAHYQVHDLDPTTWKTVEVVHIDIADRSQVEPAVSSLSISLETLCIVCMFFVVTLPTLNIMLIVHPSGHPVVTWHSKIGYRYTI